VTPATDHLAMVFLRVECQIGQVCLTDLNIQVILDVAMTDSVGVEMPP
jgi:hypothetical protein